MDQASSAASESTTRFREWRVRRSLSVHAAALKLGIPYSVARAVDNGTTIPGGVTCFKIVAGSQGELDLEDLVPSEVRYQLKRLHGYAGRRRGDARRTAAKAS